LLGQSYAVDWYGNSGGRHQYRRGPFRERHDWPTGRGRVTDDRRQLLAPRRILGALRRANAGAPALSIFHTTTNTFVVFWLARF